MTDVIRTAAVAAAAVTYALAVANLVISFLVLSDKPFTWRAFLGSGGGFLWAHIVFVTIPFQGFATWGIVEVAHRVGTPLTWRAPTLFALCTLMNVGYWIIFRVELARLRLKANQ